MSKKGVLLAGFMQAVLAAVLLGLLLFSYGLGGGDRAVMDTVGWLYLFASSLMHASLIVAVPYVVVYVPLSLLGVRHKVTMSVTGVLYAILLLLFVINRYVFMLYHFHINGFVLDMLFAEGGGDNFSIPALLYVKACVVLVGIGLVMFVAGWLAVRLTKRIERRRRAVVVTVLTLAALALTSQGLHVYGAATLRTSILEADAYLPYYFPLSMNSALDKWGIIDRKNISTMNISERASNLNYPVAPLTVDKSVLKEGRDLDIVLIVIDSWNFRTLTAEGMPHLWALKGESDYFTRHQSSSNGTRGSLFGVFTGISSYYWKSFEYSSLRPVLVDQMVEEGYDIQIYPSASFQSPPFDRMFFKGMEGLNLSTEGATAYERDCRLTENFLADLPHRVATGRPTFSLLFYDLAHAITLPKAKNNHFLPAWDIADYSRLNNSTDPTPYFNLYRNCLYQVDSLIGIVMDGLRESGMLEHSVVLVTGDHGQEFNENGKNYWGHAANYTKYQIQVPLLVYYPGVEARVYNHRTTHYDIAPTLLHRAMGVSNPPSDYSMGRALHDSTSRGWHVVGNDINYAFVTDDGLIIEKKGGGYVRVYDEDLNLLKDYSLSAGQISENLLKLNRFFK